MDMSISVLTRLKNISKTTGKPLQLYLQLFCQEEFLRKVSLSKYADNLVLKGGMFIYTLTNFESRATIDVDFLLRQLPNSIDSVKQIVEEILSADTGNNFITFESKGYITISPQREYKGVSFQLVGKIKNTKTPFNVDLGFGDIISPCAEKHQIPTQLSSFVSPVVNTYSLESTIAEKFDAILQRLELTSRMKDYYDIYYLAHTFDFDGSKLQKAVFETLNNRETEYNKESLARVIDFSENNDMKLKWNHFLKRLKVDGPQFVEVLNSISMLLHPIWNALINRIEFFGKWDARSGEWFLDE